MKPVRGIWLTAFVMVVVSAGVATGVILHQRLQSAPLAGEPHIRPSAPMLVAMLGEELRLTAEQQVRLEQIVRTRGRDFQATREAMRARMTNDASALDHEIRTQLDLTPEQQQRFEAFVARVRARFLADDLPETPR